MPTLSGSGGRNSCDSNSGDSDGERTTHEEAAAATSPGKVTSLEDSALVAEAEATIDGDESDGDDDDDDDDDGSSGELASDGGDCDGDLLTTASGDGANADGANNDHVAAATADGADAPDDGGDADDAPVASSLVAAAAAAVPADAWREYEQEERRERSRDLALAAAAEAEAAGEFGAPAAAAVAAPNVAEEDAAPPPPPPPFAAPPRPSRNPLRGAVQVASRIEDGPKRERALVAVLRGCRREVEDARAADERATVRFTAAREVYDMCARLLAAYTPLEERLEARKRAAAGGSGDDGGSGNTDGQAVKRQKPDHESPTMYATTATEVAAAVAAAEGAPLGINSTPSRGRGQVQHEGEDVVLPSNEIYLPEYFAAGGGMTEPMVQTFRNDFFLRLTRGRADSSTIDEWDPPPNNANLKSRTQLSEWIHIAKHWNTGADGLDAGAFRAKHKTWYSRMKPVSYNLGRRTGIHLRGLDVGGYEGQDVKGMTVLCRYNKTGNKSIVYLDVGRLFDALFQIHALELNHRGRDATKNLADERYANIPDGTVRAFLETCPICNARRGNGLPQLPQLDVPTQHGYA